ncbi:YjcZ family sporulation protein [Bacillus toyonensis]|nr:YjcZ family sporulation protein [Bacillus toyonensis]PEE32087.1 sporulation protein YjcZ [Bacillus toyonensis]
MGLGGKGGSGGTGGGEAGQAGKSGFPFIIVLFTVLIIVGASYSGLGF